MPAAGFVVEGTMLLGLGNVSGTEESGIVRAEARGILMRVMTTRSRDEACILGDGDDSWN